MVKDMSSGKPLKLILSFCLPLLIGNIFQQLYNMVDSIIVGKFVGKSALAAVGATGSINFLVIGFALGMCSGFAIPIAQSFGAKDYTKMRRSIRNAGYLCVLITVLLTAITVTMTPTILSWMQTPQDIFQQSYDYIVVIFYGIFATMLYNMMAGIFRALGDSKTPLYFLILSSIINIVLDLVLIIVFKMGVTGASVATVVSQAISGIACLIYMKKKLTIVAYQEDEKKLDLKYCQHLLSMGLPMALQFSITAVGSVIIQTAVNSLGSDTVAAVTAASKISMIFTTPLDTMGVTMATFGGQNLGAGKIDRVFEGLKKGLMLSIGYSLVMAVFVNVFANELGILFIDASETTILKQVGQFLKINAFFYWVLAILFILRNLLQGLGYSFLAMFGGVFELVGRAGVAFGLVSSFGYTAICFANPVAWLLADVLFVGGWLMKSKELKQMMKNQESSKD